MPFWDRRSRCDASDYRKRRASAGTGAIIRRVNASRAPSGWVPVLVAVVAASWVLAMPFQADDYLILPNTGALLGIERPPPVDDPRADAHIGNYFLFRPVPWFVWWLLIQARGGLADPLVFHAATLIFHAISAFLLWRVLRAILHPAAAQIGACLFALAPGGVQATSYVAAGGDQLAVLLMLAATACLQAHRRRPRVATALGTGAFAALAFCSKDVAVASLPAMLLAGWAVRDPAPRSLRGPLTATAAALAIAMIARAAYLKTVMPVYLIPIRLGLLALGNLHHLFFEVLVPWRRFEEVADLAPLAARIARRWRPAAALEAVELAGLAALALPVLAGLCVAPARTARRVVAAAAALACVLVPALTIFDEVHQQVISRALYPATAILAAGVAAALDPLCARGWRRLSIALALPLALVWTDFMVHVARTELRAGSAIDGRLESMRDVVRSAPAGAHVIAVDQDLALGAIPTIYFGIGPAMKPPFTRTPARVTWWGDLSTLPRSPILAEDRGPIVIARISEERYVPKEPVIPALPAVLPSFLRKADVPQAWEPGGAVPTRAVAGIRVGSGTQGVFTCTWIGSRGKRETRGALPGLGGGPHAIVSAPEDFDWLADPVLVGVRFEGADVATVEPLRELPRIVLARPSVGARLPFGGAAAGLPEVSFLQPDQPMSAEYRLTVEFAISDRERPVLISEEPAFVLRAGGDRNAWTYDVSKQRSGRILATPPVDALSFSRRIDEVIRSTGSRLLPLSLRVEGFDPRSASVECRSDWRICFLELRE
jgi:hypothetical protein